MKSFDVVVVGAGPAGGHCARLLARSGKKVLLAEQHHTFDNNNFSSAATPLETLARFDLPEEVVGSFWHTLKIISTNVRKSWESPTALGAVLNFAKLRQFLAREVEGYGGEVWMGHRYMRSFEADGQTVVEFKQRASGEAIAVNAKVLVDATGAARAVIYDRRQEQPAFFTATGIEYLIEVEEADYHHCADALIFFLGHQWMPQGYSWIFPMENYRLKVGAARYHGKPEISESKNSIKPYIELLIQEYLNLKKYNRLEIHGSTLKYSSGLKDIYYEGNKIAIGDSISTLNFLGGEGIRHGMYSSEIACKHIKDYLENKIGNFKNYKKEIQNDFIPTWHISEKSGVKVYLKYSDRAIDKGLAYLGSMKLEDVMDILFYYKFEKISKGIGRILKRKIYSFWQDVRMVFNFSSKIRRNS